MHFGYLKPERTYVPYNTSDLGYYHNIAKNTDIYSPFNYTVTETQSLWDENGQAIDGYQVKVTYDSTETVTSVTAIATFSFGRDGNGNVAIYVKKQEVNFHTQALKEVDIKNLKKEKEEKLGEITLCYGKLTVTEKYDKPLTPLMLSKIAKASEGRVSLEELLDAAGYDPESFSGLRIVNYEL